MRQEVECSTLGADPCRRRPVGPDPLAGCADMRGEIRVEMPRITRSRAGHGRGAFGTLQTRVNWDGLVSIASCSAVVAPDLWDLPLKV
jgi:hypothetical protein